MDIAIGDLIITDDEAQWRVHSINVEGTRRSVVALHLSSPTVIAVDVSRLTWSDRDKAWRLTAPGASEE